MANEKIKFDLSSIDERIKYLLAYSAYNPDVIIFDERKAKIIGFPDFTDNNPVRVVTEDDTIVDVGLHQIKLVLKPLELLDKDFFIRFYGKKWWENATTEIIKNQILAISYSCASANLYQNVEYWLLKNQFDIFDLIKEGLAVSKT